MNVEQFLAEARKRIITKDFEIIPRYDNQSTIRNLGLSLLDVEDIIYNLEPDDLFQGPVNDYKFPKDILFIFKIRDQEDNLYIKLKLDSSKLVCISFHIDYQEG